MKDVVDIVEENRQVEQQMNMVYDSMDQHNHEEDDELDEELKKMEAQMMDDNFKSAELKHRNT